GQDRDYQMTFSHNDIDRRYAKLYLHDLIENTVTDITDDGTVYSFTAESTPRAVNRFRIIARRTDSEQNAESNKINIISGDNTIYVENLTAKEAVVYLYDLSGRITQQSRLYPGAALGLSAKANSGHILKTVFSDETIINKLMITN